MLAELRHCIQNTLDNETHGKDRVNQKECPGKFAVLSEAIQYIKVLQSKNRSLAEKVDSLQWRHHDRWQEGHSHVQ